MSAVLSTPDLIDQARSLDERRQQTALTFVRTAPAGVYRPDFLGWLEKNWHVYIAFERQAELVWRRGRRRYSARTIGEFLRHETIIQERANELEFKLNDHAWPDLARLFIAMHPEMAGFFEFRTSPTSNRAPVPA